MYTWTLSYYLIYLHVTIILNAFYFIIFLKLYEVITELLTLGTIYDFITTEWDSTNLPSYLYIGCVTPRGYIFWSSRVSTMYFVNICILLANLSQNGCMWLSHLRQFFFSRKLLRIWFLCTTDLFYFVYSWWLTSEKRRFISG